MTAERHLVLQGVVGSTAYGLAHEGSDVDRLGVFQFPTEHILGRIGKGECKEDTLVELDPLPDRQIHEVGKYLRMASEGNPTVSELLWLDTYEVIEGAGHILVANRQLLLSQEIRDSYVGYARQQAVRLLGRAKKGKTGFMSKKSTEKHGRHCARLVLQGQDALANGMIRVRLNEDEADYVREIGKLATRSPDQFWRWAEAEFKEMDAIDSCLPVRPDMDAIRDLLVRIRLEHNVG